MKLLSGFALILQLTSVVECVDKPNVVIIMADDMGSYDASYRGSNQILTPNIDALAYNGIILDRFYTPSMCTPSRSSLMTGKYPHSLGMHHWVIRADEAYGLGLNEKLMPQYFQEAGYATHLIGKWHLGFFQRKYTPVHRGFDSFFGYYNGLIDYYNYTYVQPGNLYVPGYDFHKNDEVFRDIEAGTYATDLFTDEALNIIKHHPTTKPLFMMFNHLAPHTGNAYELLQAPEDEIAKFSHIADPNRRILAAMISKLDESVGKVVEALKEKELLSNTIILFFSDNGAPTAGLFENSGSNHPLKGQKNSPWEGAHRNLAAIYSPLIAQSQKLHKGYIHISDILPTLASAAGIEINPVEGFDQWKALVAGETSPRSDIVCALDPVFGYSAIISDEWKFVNGTSLDGLFDKHLGEIQEFNLDQEEYENLILQSKVGKALNDVDLKLTAKSIHKLRRKSTISCRDVEEKGAKCNPLQSPCLFNIIEDPCERRNLADVHPEIVFNLQQQMNHLVENAAPVRRTFISDPRSDPLKHNGAWDSYVSDLDC